MKGEWGVEFKWKETAHLKNKTNLQSRLHWIFLGENKMFFGLKDINGKPRSKSDILAIAKKYNVKGRTKMNKQQLIQATYGFNSNGRIANVMDKHMYVYPTASWDSHKYSSDIEEMFLSNHIYTKALI
jgi:hypothetical protein